MVTHCEREISLRVVKTATSHCIILCLPSYRLCAAPGLPPLLSLTSGNPPVDSSLNSDKSTSSLSEVSAPSTAQFNLGEPTQRENVGYQAMPPESKRYYYQLTRSQANHLEPSVWAEVYRNDRRKHSHLASTPITVSKFVKPCLTTTHSAAPHVLSMVTCGDSCLTKIMLIVKI